MPASVDRFDDAAVTYEASETVQVGEFFMAERGRPDVLAEVEAYLAEADR